MQKACCHKPLYLTLNLIQKLVAKDGVDFLLIYF